MKVSISTILLLSVSQLAFAFNFQDMCVQVEKSCQGETLSNPSCLGKYAQIPQLRKTFEKTRFIYIRGYAGEFEGNSYYNRSHVELFQNLGIGRSHLALTFGSAEPAHRQAETLCDRLLVEAGGGDSLFIIGHSKGGRVAVNLMYSTPKCQNLVNSSQLRGVLILQGAFGGAEFVNRPPTTLAPKLADKAIKLWGNIYGHNLGQNEDLTLGNDINYATPGGLNLESCLACPQKIQFVRSTWDSSCDARRKHKIKTPTHDELKERTGQENDGRLTIDAQTIPKGAGNHLIDLRCVYHSDLVKTQKVGQPECSDAMNLYLLQRATTALRLK